MSAIAVPENDTIEQKGRSKLDTMRRTLARREAEIVETQEHVRTLRADEEQAIAESARRAPTRRIFEVGSPVERIRRKRAKLEATLADRKREVEALRLALDEEQAERADANLAATSKRLRVGHDRQRAAWERASALLVDLADTWAELASEIEDADEEAGRTLASDAYRLASDEAKADLDHAAGAVALVEPCPRSLGAFCLRLIEAATSDENRTPDYTEVEHGQGERLDPKTGLRVPLPPRVAKVDSQARYLDRRRVLRDLAPDLRAARRLRPSQRVEVLGGSPSVEMIS